MSLPSHSTIPNPRPREALAGVSFHAGSVHWQEASPIPQAPERRPVPVWKRALDLGLTLLAAPVWVPTLLGLGLYVKLISPGPALFCQERVGHGGRRFTCLKLRSMHAHTETGSHERHLENLMGGEHPMTKLDAADDPRLIRGGKLLRATGLDELPQLINVLRGEMSLVGPRPCTPFEYDRYEPAQKQRFRVPPGLTGLWQVSGKNKTTFREMITLDLFYSEALSLRWDLRILFRTLPALLEQVREARPAQPSPERPPAGYDALHASPARF